MFKIYDDKVYFVAETPDINKVIEIFLPKDDRGTIMDTKTILSKRARILPNTNSATLISITRRKSMRWASISCF